MEQQQDLNFQLISKCMAETLAIILRDRQGVVVYIPKDENNLNEPNGTFLVWKDKMFIRVMSYNGFKNAGSIIFVDQAIENECKGSC